MMLSENKRNMSFSGVSLQFLNKVRPLEWHSRDLIYMKAIESRYEYVQRKL